MIDIYTQEKFASEIANYIISKVLGTHDDDTVIKEKPNRLYLIGTLASRKIKDTDIEERIDDGKAASIRASKLKVSIVTNKKDLEYAPKAMIRATGNVYYKVKNTYCEKSADSEIGKGHEINSWKRMNFINEFNCDLSCDSSFTLDFMDIIKKANTDPLIATKISENLWNAEITVNLRDYNSNDCLISFGFENTSNELEEGESKKNSDFERTLFNCKLEVHVRELQVKEFRDDYSYEGYPQRYFYDFRTINCQAKWVDRTRNQFITDHFARFEQPNIRPREVIPGINLTFSNLMSSEIAIPALEGFIDQMKNQNMSYKNNIPQNILESDFQPRINNRQITWGERIKLASHFESLICRVEKGLELIKTDPKVKQSFFKTNEAFFNYYANQDKPVFNAGWRLFQLAFFLSSIESVAKKSDLDTVDVLHVDTGGGKSEAYFALVVFTSFYERCIGRKEGVSSIVKFPLRMLSIQQLERATSIIIHAEDVRKKYENLFSGSPFSLGYYVGSKSGEFPDLYSKVRENLYEKATLKSPAPPSKIISKCPLCPPNLKGTIRLIEDTTHKRVNHKCDKCGKEYHVYLSDREIFRWRPTVIVSTVDKWASLSTQRRARNLLGGTGSMCPEGHGFIPSGDKCEDNKEEEAFQCPNLGENNLSNDGPRLSIQDEMHLLREGFGTISSHFEGLIETIVEDRTNRKLKHIAMSATLNGTKKQIKELYNKKYFVIPGRCPEGPGVQSDFFFEKKDGPKRIIYGLKPNLRDNHYASLRSLLHFAEFITNAQKNLNSNPHDFCAKYGLNDALEAQKLLNQYLVPLTYHIKKQDAYDMGRLKDAVVSDSLKESFGSDMQGKVLTGDSDLEELKEAIDKVRDFVKRYNPKSVDSEGIVFEPIYATSVVSHGVDLDELNFMTFQGLPYSTSEYIQALSRVGRKNLGMILLWFYPNRVRDESFYRNFMRYHDSLDHEVCPVPINRNSRLGLMQTVNSAFCAGIINYLSNKKGRPLYRKKDVIELTLEEKESLVEFIEKAYGQTILEIDVSKEVEERIKEVVLGKDKETQFFPNILTKSGNTFFHTQSGMRGIQKQLALGLKVNDEKIIKRMEQ